MKIVYIVPKITNCGPVNVVLNLVQELSLDTNISISIVSIRSNEDDKYISKFMQAGVKEYFCLEDVSILKRVSSLNKFISNADIIHSHGFFPDLYSIFITNNRIRRITTAHCIFLKDYQLEYGFIKGSIYSLLHHSTYWTSRFHKIVGCSYSVEKYLKKTSYIGRHNITSIHNGVSTSVFKPLQEPEKTIKRIEFFEDNMIFNIPDNILIFSGRLIRRKKAPEMIKWFLESTFNQNSILIILGNGEELDQCASLSKNHKNIILKGFVENVIPYYQISDFLVSFSDFEGFPMSVLEAISCGCKAILSDIPPHREVSEIFPENATIIDSYNKLFSESLTIKKNLCYLSSKRMANEYINLYKSTLL